MWYPSDLIIGERGPRYGPDGWVQTHGFLEHHARVGQGGQVFDRRCTPSKAGSQLSLESVLDMRMMGEQVPRPGEAEGDRLVAGEQNGEHFVTNLSVAHLHPR